MKKLRVTRLWAEYWSERSRATNLNLVRIMKQEELIRIIDPKKELIEYVSGMPNFEFGNRRLGGHNTKVLRLYLKNTLIISLASGDMTYSSDGTYEVAILKDGQINYELTNGDVLKFQSPEDIRELVIKCGSIKQA